MIVFKHSKRDDTTRLELDFELMLTSFQEFFFQKQVYRKLPETTKTGGLWLTKERTNFS